MAITPLLLVELRVPNEGDTNKRVPNQGGIMGNQEEPECESNGLAIFDSRFMKFVLRNQWEHKSMIS